MNPLNLFEYEAAAREKMEQAYYEFYAGGVADNLTLSENRAAFERIKLRPRVLVNVEKISTETQVQNQTLPTPLMIAPTAMHKLAHPDGELATARAAKKAGVPLVLSTVSTVAVEEVAAEAGTLWFQLYTTKDRRQTAALIARAEDASCQALVLTVDVPVAGLRENLTRVKYKPPANLPRPHLAPFEDLRTRTGYGGFARDHLDNAFTWDDLAWLQAQTKMPLWLKGILRADDAQRAADAGVAGIIVSNHGGRQLDSAIATIDALPEITAAVGDQIEVLIDGGVRRGVDIIKALALGAKGVLIGRPPLWGLAVAGEAGVTAVLNLLRTEFENAMALCGCPTIADIDRSLVKR